MFCRNYLQFNRQFCSVLSFCSALPIQGTVLPLYPIYPSAANMPAAVAAVDRRDSRTDSLTDARPFHTLLRACGQHQYNELDDAVAASGVKPAGEDTYRPRVAFTDTELKTELKKKFGPSSVPRQRCPTWRPGSSSLQRS